MKNKSNVIFYRDILLICIHLFIWYFFSIITNLFFILALNIEKDEMQINLKIWYHFGFLGWFLYNELFKFCLEYKSLDLKIDSDMLTCMICWLWEIYWLVWSADFCNKLVIWFFFSLCDMLTFEFWWNYMTTSATMPLILFFVFSYQALFWNHMIFYFFAKLYLNSW